MTYNLKVYILSLTVVAMISSAIPSLIPAGMARSSVKMMCGILLVMAVLSPLRKFEISTEKFSEFADTVDAIDAVEQGTGMFTQQRNDIIIRQLETYIQDRAASLGISAQVELILDSQGIPAACVIRADVTQDQRKDLGDVLEKELGIAKEYQQWDG